jgi:hypothetical protein
MKNRLAARSSKNALQAFDLIPTIHSIILGGSIGEPINRLRSESQQLSDYRHWTFNCFERLMLIKVVNLKFEWL